MEGLRLRRTVWSWFAASDSAHSGHTPEGPFVLTSSVALVVLSSAAKVSSREGLLRGHVDEFAKATGQRLLRIRVMHRSFRADKTVLRLTFDQGWSEPLDGSDLMCTRESWAQVGRFLLTEQRNETAVA